MTSLATESVRQAPLDGQIGAALIEFGLSDAFALRTANERARCVSWVSEAGDSADVQLRVALLLDALYSGEPLPGADGSVVGS
jgi:hypothetical protein